MFLLRCRAIRPRRAVRCLSTATSARVTTISTPAATEFDPFCGTPELDDARWQDIRERLRILGVNKEDTPRKRNHVNPLASFFQKTPPTPVWTGPGRVVDNPELPLYVDVGCGSAGHLVQMALVHQGKANFVGVEIREALVESAMERRDRLNLDNASILFGNASAVGAWDALFSGYPGPVVAVSVMMPDPWFKKAQHKRRVVTEYFARTVAERVCEGGRVFVESDVLSVAAEMRERLGNQPALRDVSRETSGGSALRDHESGQYWVHENPTGVFSPRERVILSRGEQIWRALFVKDSGAAQGA